MWPRRTLSTQVDDEAPAGEPALHLVTPLPAGCLRIDSALGEVPPDIFGQALMVDTSARTRGGRRAREVSGAHAAAAAAKAERIDARLRKRKARRSADGSRHRGLQPETRASVHSFHAKRRALCPPYDPYVDDIVARGGGLWQDLADAARQRSEVDREAARRVLLDESGRRDERRIGREAGPGRPASEPTRSRYTYFPRPRNSSRCLRWVSRPNLSGSCRGGPSRVVPSSPVGQSDGRGSGVCVGLLV